MLQLRPHLASQERDEAVAHPCWQHQFLAAHSSQRSAHRADCPPMTNAHARPGELARVVHHLNEMVLQRLVLLSCSQEPQHSLNGIAQKFNTALVFLA